MGEAGFPGKTLARAASAAPAGPLPGRLAHTSGVSHPRTHSLQHHQLRWARARETPPWWHADLCEDKEYSRSDKDWRATILAKILAEENPQGPRRGPCRGRQCATARPLPGHPPRPLPRASAGPLRGPRQPSLHRRSHVAASPTSWAGTCVATCSFQANSAHACVAACRSS